MRKIYCPLGLLALLFTYSCESKNAEEEYPTVDCNTEQLTYDTDVKPIVDANCAVPGCHVPGTGRAVLENYVQVKSIVDNGQFEDRVLTNKTMPPNQALSVCNLDKLQAWLNNGAPEN